MEELMASQQVVSEAEKGLSPMVEHEHEGAEEEEEEVDASGTPTNDMVTTSFMSSIDEEVSDFEQPMADNESRGFFERYERKKNVIVEHPSSSQYEMDSFFFTSTTHNYRKHYCRQSLSNRLLKIGDDVNKIGVCVVLFSLLHGNLSRSSFVMYLSVLVEILALEKDRKIAQFLLEESY
jgi:hypothetical protein